MPALPPPRSVLAPPTPPAPAMARQQLLQRLQQGLTLDDQPALPRLLADL